MPEPVPVVRVTADADDAMAKLAGAGRRTKAMRVALAEDSVLLREGVQRLLTESGFEVISAAGDAEELLANVRKDPPDVAIIDIRMPPDVHRRGADAAHTIRAELPDVAVLLLSQHVEADFAVELVSRRRGAARLPAQGPGLEHPGIHRRRTAGGGGRLGHRSRGGLAPRRPGTPGQPARRLTDSEREVLA